MTQRSNPRPYGRAQTGLAKRLLPHRVDCYRRQDVREDGGSRAVVPIEGRQPLLRNVHCWVQPASPQQQLEAERLNLVVTHTVTFFEDPQVSNGDYFLFRGSRILLIQGINDAMEVGLVWVAQAREIG